MTRFVAISVLLTSAVAVRDGFLKLQQNGTASKRCPKGLRRDAGLGLVEVESPALGGVFADGWSRVGCDTDISPEAERTYFNDHACGKVKSCRLLEMPMQPRLCFDFCRQVETAKFFALQGGKCYCATYFHAKSTGGGGCGFACEGDSKEMCGSSNKQSWFEMHMCADSESEADTAITNAQTAAGLGATAVATSEALATKLRAVAKKWPELGVCSVKPEGELVCKQGQAWLDLAARTESAAAGAGHASDVLNDTMTVLSAAKVKSVAESANNSLTAQTASTMELATHELRAKSAELKGEVAATNLEIQGVNGPLAGNALDAAVFNGSYQALPQNGSSALAGWNGLCALTPLKGQNFASNAANASGVSGPATCAAKCLGYPSQACAAFNYQSSGGWSACQLLSSEGLVKPSISKAIPIFEISDTKRDDMGFDSIACYANKAFINGHPQGPLKASVVRTVQK